MANETDEMAQPRLKKKYQEEIIPGFKKSSATKMSCRSRALRKSS